MRLFHVFPGHRCCVASSVSIPGWGEFISIKKNPPPTSSTNIPTTNPFSFFPLNYFVSLVVHRIWLSIQNRHVLRPYDDFAVRLDPCYHRRCCVTRSSTFVWFSGDSVMPNRMVRMYVHRSHGVYLLAIDLDTILRQQQIEKRIYIFR